jgi:carboxylate-amine ligase
MASAFVPTIGVEEEFLLLDPINGRPVPAGPAVLDALAGTYGPRGELMRHQVEGATSVCTELAQVRMELRRLRRMLGAAAVEQNCRLAATGISPYANPGLLALSDGWRYRRLAQRYPGLTAGAGVCGCHVHVGVPSRDFGARALGWLPPWLAPVLALSANSPISAGHDTGWHSRRYALAARWPSARPPAAWRGSAHYDATVRRLITSGAAMDARSVYYLARLSPRYPTIEVRVADVCPDVDTAVLVAALVRGLVMTALQSVRDGRRPPRTAPGAVDAGLAAAARTGLPGEGIDVMTGARVPQRTLIAGLRRHVDEALALAGDQQAVDHLLSLLADRGTGAERQRLHWRRDPSPVAFVRALARCTQTEPALRYAGAQTGRQPPLRVNEAARCRAGREPAGGRAVRRDLRRLGVTTGPAGHAPGRRE